MKTWAGVRNVNVVVALRLLAVLAIGLLETGVGFAKWNPTPRHLEALDPTFMKAVTASVSQHDVKTILAHQRSSGPVHVQLYTSCDEEQRCTILTTMDFSDAQFDASTISLKVAVHVMPETDGPHKTIRSSWQVQSMNAAFDAHTTYAGDFSDLKGLPAIGDNHAIAGLLTAIQAAIRDALGANGVIAKPNTAKVQMYECPPACHSARAMPPTPDESVCPACDRAPKSLQARVPWSPVQTVGPAR